METHLAWELGITIAIILTLIGIIYRTMIGKIDKNDAKADKIVSNYNDKFKDVKVDIKEVSELLNKIDKKLDHQLTICQMKNPNLKLFGQLNENC